VGAEVHPSRQAGFTILELILVTLLLTILASVALPNLQAFRIRSGRAEVVTQLSALSHAEFAYYGRHNRFTDDLRLLDWSIQGSPRFLYGFTTDTSGSSVNDTAELRAAGHGGFTTGRMVDSFGLLLTEGDLPTAALGAETFRVGAVGNLDWDPALDRWTLDRDGTLTNVSDEVEN
jgi:prepilin-type N-terminal cleavage/methylation domain-containing protein